MEGLDEGSDIAIEAEITKAKENKAILTRGSFLMKITNVEAMYRWMDLRECLGQEKARLAGNNGLGEPTNGPDSECNGLPRGSRHWVFVHGFNVNVSEARGWASTMFKRLWQTGDNSRFTFANWAGDEGQFYSLSQGLASLDYYQNSENAFNSASNFYEKCTALNRSLSATNPTEDYLVGHSLGNVLISEAIQEYGLKIR